MGAYEASDGAHAKTRREKRPSPHEAESKFQRGDDVVVLETFLSDSKPEVELRKGLRGRVVHIDSEGDAQIRFEGIESLRWVFHSNFDKLDKALLVQPLR